MNRTPVQSFYRIQADLRLRENSDVNDRSNATEGSEREKRKSPVIPRNISCRADEWDVWWMVIYGIGWLDLNLWRMDGWVD